ncbi:MAG: MotA/TolQ/ExbB proton channel family protein [Synergistaceae bacterium]|nr:MotA/TolQ/ExbB proton channel family protein [Synergistaceae bacterium]
MDLNLFKLGGPLMWVIGAVSVLAFAIVIERLLFFRRASTDPMALETALGKALYEGDEAAAKAVVKSGSSSLHRLFEVAITHWQAEPDSLETLMEQQLRRELFRWEKGLGTLATIARVAPLLGLLGTVLGMVSTFRGLPAVSGSVPGGAGMAELASGIWVALLTTVAGLAVAVPVILCHTYLSARVDSEEETLNRGVDFLVREKLLQKSPRTGDPARP